MATSFVFNGKTITLPGSYSTIKSGMKNPPIALPFGNVLIIDTGSGTGYGGGAGINGEFAKGKESIYDFDNIEDYRDFQKGGLWWLLGQPMFRPAGLGINGVSKISCVKAATTIAARIHYNFTSDVDSSVSHSIAGNTLEIAVTDEGLIGNGALGTDTGATTNLIKGFAGKLSQGEIDTTKFVLTFYRGTYKGLDQNNLPYDGINQASATPIVVAQSPEFTYMRELVAWMNIDFNFNKHFKLITYAIVGTGELVYNDVIQNGSYALASGGTETYVAANLLTDTLSAVADLDINFIFADNWGANAQSSKNFQILTHIIEDSKFKPELYVGGGDDINTYQSQSIGTAVFYNNDSVTVVHAGVKKQSQQGLRKYNVMYHAAAVLGKEAGQEPQVPITFKSLDFDGMLHLLNDKEATQALNAGVVVTRLENGNWDIVKGVNTYASIYLVDDNGKTASKQIKRIARQLNKEIIVNSKKQLLKNPNGTNRNTLSEIDVVAWLIGYLKSKQATVDVDNLILNFQDIVVTRTGDAYNITYKFTPNSEISFLFFTGLIINV